MSSARTFENFCDRLRSAFSSSTAPLFVAVIVILWRLILSSPADPDLFARVAMGRLVAVLGAVPLHDPFAFTEKLPVWIDHEWLSGVVFYSVAVWFGDTGLILLKLVLAAWTCSLLVRASTVFAPTVPGRLLWTTVCVLEASFVWGNTVRCQVFTYFVIALTYYAFVQYRILAIKRYLILIPLASLGLVNMHGGYALEIMILWLMVICSLLQRERWRLLALIAGFSSLAPAATPYGFEMFVTYLFHALSMERPSISEWFPLYQHPLSFARILAIAALLACGLAATLRNKKWDLISLTLLCFAFYCGFKHLRFTGFAMLTAVVFGATYIGQLIALVRRRFATRALVIERAGALVGAGALVVMVLQIGSAALKRDTWVLNTNSYPLGAVEWLRRSGETGRLLVDFNNGSFALWRLYPHFLVSLDGRYEEVYRNETLRDVSQALSPETPEGETALERINPTHIISATSTLSQERVSRLSVKWQEVYRDEQYVVFGLRQERHEKQYEGIVPVSLWESLF